IASIATARSIVRAIANLGGPEVAGAQWIPSGLDQARLPAGLRMGVDGSPCGVRVAATGALARAVRETDRSPDRCRATRHTGRSCQQPSSTREDVPRLDI